jgi:hypothetical protein
MTEKVGHMRVIAVTEREDGDVTVDFELDDTTTALAQEMGLKLLIYCGATGTDLDYVFKAILGETDD